MQAGNGTQGAAPVVSIRHLSSLFRPQSIAVFGASDTPGRMGNVVMRNLLTAGFAGPVMPVNPKYRSAAGVLAYPDVNALPLTPDLAVVCTPPESVPAIIDQLGCRGTRAAVVLTAGLDGVPARGGATPKEEMLEAARKHDLRILGPNCLGVLVPGHRLNASFAHRSAPPGPIAFVSQSGALCTAVLDWAQPRGIGFSHFISLGDHADVDFGDVLDYLSADAETRSILLYIESISDARKFMSAARAAARNKTVIAIKAGRFPEGARAAASHTGALAGADDVYDVALRRAGVLRVFTIDELFDAAETLGRAQPMAGDRLTILTNGGGPGVMATDALIAGGGELSQLSSETLEKLDAVLPPNWSRNNPIDIIGDAGPERYEAALRVLLAERSTDPVLVLHVPTALSSSSASARAVAGVARDSGRSVLTCWLGGSSVGSARTVLEDAGIADYATPEHAVSAFLQMLTYRRNREQLMEVPASMPEDFEPRPEVAREIITRVLHARRTTLTEPETKAVLSAYDIPCVETHTAVDAGEAKRVAERLDGPCALKILSPDISHKSDLGGVTLDLATPQAVFEAAQDMRARLQELRPQARVEGFTVQPMERRPGAFELILGMSTDATFGPVIAFGEGGTAVEVVADRALALPPLNMHMAAEMVARTRIFRRLRGYRGKPGIDFQALYLTLVKLSQLIIDLAEVVELDINPLLADAGGVVALDARMVVRDTSAHGAERLAIRPYPRELEEWITLGSGRRLLLRPIRPEDEHDHDTLFEDLNPEDIRFRFFGMVRSLPHSERARYTQIDYDREMAFIAASSDPEGPPENLGVVRAISTAGGDYAEFAIIVRPDMKDQGLGRALLEKMIRYLRSRGIRELRGEVLASNGVMLGLARSLGFQVAAPVDGIVHVSLRL
jgi:acetyltransferase